MSGLAEWHPDRASNATEWRSQFNSAFGVAQGRSVGA